MTTLPSLFDIFLRSGSRIQPEIAASAHGRQPCSWWLRTTLPNSHVRMMSWDCGRMSMGNTLANRSGSSTHPPGDVRSHRRGRPRVHHVGITDEPTWLAALILGEARG